MPSVIGCKTSSETHQSHDYFQYNRRAYHRIAAFNGVIEPQQDGRLHWHIMLYTSVLSPELLEKAVAASSMALQSQIGNMLDSLQYHVTFINGTMIYFLQLNMVVNNLEVLI